MRVYKISTDLTKEREELLSSTFSREEEKTIFNYFESGNITYDIIDENGFITSY